MPALLTRMSTPPKAADDRGDAGVDRLLVGHVHRHADRLAARGLDLGGGRVGRVLVQVGDRDLGAFAREDDRDLLADAAGGAGDDGEFVLEFHVVVS